METKQLGLPIGPNECRFYEGCTAPLCPLNTNLGRSFWFPGEPICHLKEAPDWVRKQRKIARIKSTDQGRGFTIRMLASITQTPRGLQGVTPDDPVKERAWLRQQERAQRVRKARKKKAGQARLSTDF